MNGKCLCSRINLVIKSNTLGTTLLHYYVIGMDWIALYLYKFCGNISNFLYYPHSSIVRVPDKFISFFPIIPTFIFTSSEYMYLLYIR